jgi:hydroxymethylglutaryl-CoA lyase
MDAITISKDKLAAHYHNTYDRAIDNLVISLYNGIKVVDSSIAGLGGCPYASGASGNVPTEDVLLLLEVRGIFNQ